MKGPTVVGAFAVLLAGCWELDEEPQYGRRVSVGQHVELWASPSVEVCGGTIDYMDRFTESLREEVGPHPAAEESRRYYVLDETDWSDFTDAVGCRGSGCTTASRTIYTAGFAPSPHELVHGELFTGGHRFLEEGLAMVYGEALPDTDVRTYDVFDGLSETWVAADAYARAGHFARFVIHRHGIEAFIAVKDASWGDASFDELSDIFDDVVGEGLGPLLEAYEAWDPDCSPPGIQALLVECGQPVSQWQPTDNSFHETIEFESSFSCSDGNVMGPVRGEAWVTRAFELETSAYILSYIEGAKVTISRCDATCGSDTIGRRLDTFVTATRNTPLEQELPAGRYTVRIAKPLSRGAEPVLVRLHKFR